MADQTFNSAAQKHFIDPWNQRVFQFNTDNSDVFLSRVANSLFHVFGDDIVMHGLEVSGTAHTDDSVAVTLTLGDLLQDNTLIKIPDPVQLEFAGLSGLDEDGRIVVLSNYRYLETFEKNDQFFQIAYINTSGDPHSPIGFDSTRDRIVLGIFQFRKDVSDNVISFAATAESTIEINNKLYYLRGFHPDNRRLSAYLQHQLFSANLSIVLDAVEGIKLRNDEANPGISKYYGTGPSGNKGFFDVSTLAYDNKSTLIGYDDAYNVIMKNGNLFYLAPGADLEEFFNPLVGEPQSVFTNQFWDPALDATWNDVDTKWVHNDISPGHMELIVKPGTYWNLGFRPARMIITGTVVSTDLVELYDANGNVLGNAIASAPSVNVDLVFYENVDISRVNLYGYSEITDIEFIGGVLGEPPWVSVFDNTQWDVFANATWEDTYWNDSVSSPGVMELEVNADAYWSQGFLPNRLRITGTTVFGSNVILRDTEGNDMCLAANAEPYVEIDLTDTGYSPDRLILGGYNTVTNIEFLGGTLGQAPEWVTVFDNTKWEEYTNAQWNGIAWVGDGTTGNMRLQVPLGTYWSEGFRPDRVRVTGLIQFYSQVSLLGREDGGTGDPIIFAQGATAEVVELPITFSQGEDIKQLDLLGYNTVSKIEFLGGTLGQEPAPLTMLSNTYWDADPAINAGWDGTKWVENVSSPGMMDLVPKVGTYWKYGFRPNKIIIEGVVGTVDSVILKDSEGNDIVSANTAPRLEIDLFDDWGDYNIGNLQLRGYSQVTNIQFIGGTVGTEPDTWDQAFDFNYWDDGAAFLDWDGTKWVFTSVLGSRLDVVDDAVWHQGFRPLRARITGVYDPSHESDLVEFRAANNAILGNASVTGNVTEIHFTGVDQDISSLHINSYSEVTNIEFLGGVFNPEPAYIEVETSAEWSTAIATWDSVERVWTNSTPPYNNIFSASGSWVTGFQPEKIKIIGTVANTGQTIQLSDGTNVIASSVTSVTGSQTFEMNCDWILSGAGDITQLILNGFSQIDSILFLGGTLGEDEGPI